MQVAKLAKHDTYTKNLFLTYQLSQEVCILDLVDVEPDQSWA